MKLLVQELLPSKAIEETPVPEKYQYPLIAKWLQKEHYIGIIGVAIPSVSSARLPRS
ncbi:hypothetical protein [Anabaena azotica]|uniref:hypothetical protein n=1 Tax=Anabaena azotica TaxID=197653 RepID=UPI0039A5E37A